MQRLDHDCQQIYQYTLVYYQYYSSTLKMNFCAAQQKQQVKRLLNNLIDDKCKRRAFLHGSEMKHISDST
jgi:hypothetical protein